MLDRYEDPVFKLDLQELPAYRFVELAGAVYQSLKNMDENHETRYDKHTRLKFNKLQKIAQDIIVLIQAYEKDRQPVTVSDFLIEDYVAARNRWARVQNPEYFRNKIKEEREKLQEEQSFYEKNIEEQSKKVAAMEDELRHEINSKRDRIVSEKAALKLDQGDYQDRLAQDDNDEALSGCCVNLQQRRETKRKADIQAKLEEIRIKRDKLKDDQKNVGDDEQRKQDILNELAELNKQKVLLDAQLTAPARRIGLFSAVFPNLGEARALRKKAELETALKVVKERLADLDKKEARLNAHTNPDLEWEEEVLRLADDRKTNIDMVLSQPVDENLISARMEKEKWDAARSLAMRQKDIDDMVNRYYGAYPAYYMFEMIRLYILLVDCVQALDHRPEELRLQLDKMHEAAKVVYCPRLNHRSLFTLHAKADSNPEEKMQPLYQDFDDELDGRKLDDREKNLRAAFLLRVFSVKDFNAIKDAALFRKVAPGDLQPNDKGKEEEVNVMEEVPVKTSLTK